MFDQLSDLPYDLVRERLMDARRERMAAEETTPAFMRLAGMRVRVANRLGDVLIAWGSRLKHEDPCQDFSGGWAWQDRS